MSDFPDERTKQNAYNERPSERIVELVGGITEDVDEHIKWTSEDGLSRDEFESSRAALLGAVNDFEKESNADNITGRAVQLLTAYSTLQASIQTIFGSTAPGNQLPNALQKILKKLGSIGSWIWQMILTKLTPKEWSAKFSITAIPFIPHLGAIEIKIKF